MLSEDKRLRLARTIDEQRESRKLRAEKLSGFLRRREKYMQCPMLPALRELGTKGTSLCATGRY